jgi:hypothetical protein
MTDALLLPIVFLCLGLTIGGYALRNTALAYGGGGAWVIFGLFCYSTSVTEWDIYYSLFWLGLGLAIICFLQPAIFPTSQLEENLLDAQDIAEDERFNKEAEAMDRKLSSIAKGTRSGRRR